MDPGLVISVVALVTAIVLGLLFFFFKPTWLERDAPWLSDPEVRAQAIEDVVDTALIRVEARIQPILDRAPDMIGASIRKSLPPLVERVEIMFHDTAESMAEAIQQAIAGSIAGGLGGVLQQYLEARTSEKAHDASEKGVASKALRGFKNQAAREIAAELDPTGGLIANKLLDMAEEHDVDPDEALQWGLTLYEKYGDKVGDMMRALSERKSKKGPGKGHQGYMWG